MDKRAGIALDVGAGAMVMVGLYMALSWAPTEATMGHVQRVFYFHVATAWVGFFGFFATFLASALYLWRGAAIWDIIAASSEEVGFTFITMTIITGSIWAKPVWNVWWTWEPRLTTSAILWLIYVAYMMLRQSVDDPIRRARFSAVYGIVGFISVPITFMAIRWWRTIHPVILQSEGFALSGRMLTTLFVAIGAFTLLYATLVNHRVQLARIEEKVAMLRGRLERSDR